MSIYKKYTQDVGIIGITNLLLALRGLIFLPLITKTLGASGYGIMTQVMVTLSLLSPLASLNLAASLARFLAAEKDKREIQEGFSSVTIPTLGWSLFLALILFLSANPFARTLLEDPGLVQIVRITAIIVPFSTLELMCLGFFRAFREMKTYSAFMLARDFVELGLIAGLVLSGHGIWGAVISLLIARVLGDAVMLWMIISRIGLKLPSFSKLGPYLSFGLPLIPGMLASWAVNASDRYVIGFFLGTAAVGIYSAGYALGNVISFFTGPLAVVMLPTLSKLYDEEKAEVKIPLAYSLKYFLMLAIPSVFGLSVLAKPLLAVLSKPEFVPTGSLVTPIVAVSYLLLGVYVIFSQVFVLVKQTRIIGALWLMAALLNLGLNIAFVPKFGVIASAIATLICHTLVAAIVAFLSRKYLKFDVNGIFTAKSAVASVIMSLIIWRLNPTGLVNVLWVIGLGALIYFVLLFLAKGFATDELRFFRGLFQRG